MGDDPSDTSHTGGALPIFLLGFMGAGKTSVGRELARILGYRFFDLDEVIEQREGKSITAIFADAGEPEFRRIERAAIQACKDAKNSVIALGGGAYVSEENRSLIRSLGISIWLDCPLEICLKRADKDGSRPLLSGREEMESLLTRRRVFYQEADFIIDSGHGTPSDIAFEIISEIGI